MAAALAFCSTSVFSTSNKIPKSNHNAEWRLKQKDHKQAVNCQSGGNSMTKKSISSTSTGALSSFIKVMKDHHHHHHHHHVSTVSTDDSLFTLGHDGNGIGIKKFLGGKTLFVTGATGFLGKVLIEKLLRAVPDIRKIFILVNVNNKEVALKRVEDEIINGEIFKCLKQQHGKSYSSFMLSKIEPILGNVCQNNLGLDKSIAATIAKEVDIIVNSAANTTFDERYDVALDINTCGPSRLMSFAKQCDKIKLFVQVSTAYVNGQRQGRVMEKPFYPGESILFRTDLNVDDEIKLVQEAKQGPHDDAALLIQKMKKLGSERANKFGWQDSYVFTKAMGEMMMDNMRGDLPVVTIRPSIIESTCREPFPGWIEGIRMMDPVLLYYGKGQIPGFTVDPNEVLDVVPVDMVVNAMIAAMAKHGAVGTPGINVYHIASSVGNPLGNKDLFSYVYEHFNSSPLIDSKGAPVHVSRFKMFSSTKDFSSHLKSLSRKSIEQIMNLANLYKPYSAYKGRFDNTNTRMLMECMSTEEQMEFGFNVNDIDWKDYICSIHIPGFRKYVMKGRLG